MSNETMWLLIAIGVVGAIYLLGYLLMIFLFGRDTDEKALDGRIYDEKVGHYRPLRRSDIKNRKWKT